MSIDNTLIELLISKVEAIDEKLDNHIKHEENTISELLDAWNTSKGAFTAIKWFTYIITSVALTWAWIHNHFSIGIKS